MGYQILRARWSSGMSILYASFALGVVVSTTTKEVEGSLNR